MLDYIVRRIFIGLVTILITTVIAFAIIQLPPGDFVTSYIIRIEAMGGTVGETQAAHLREIYGLDQPIYVQYYRWMRNVVRGRFGYSFERQRPVREVIGDRLGVTVVVSLAAVLLTWVLAVPIGIYSAVKQYSIGDYIFTFLGFIGIAVPSFLLALVVMYVALTQFGADVGGLYSTEYVHAPWSWAKFVDMLKHLPTAAIVLGIAGTATTIRVLRANLLDELGKPYVITARAKGLPEHRLILKYPVRVALNPFVSTVGYLFPYIVSGSIIVSLVLALPTVGPILLMSLLAQDMFLAGTIILLLSVTTVIGTFLSDLLLVWLDPRIRTGGVSR